MKEIGVIFDWDGVIIDSSGAHEESWERLAREEGRSLPENHFKKGFGMKNEVIIPELLEWTGAAEEVRRLSLRKEALYREVVEEWGIRALPGVHTFLAELRDAGIPCVVGSSTHRLNITSALELLGLSGFFTELVTAEDVSRGKPDPEVFLLAAEKIGRSPERCVVFEDALAGIAAARNGGMKVVAVATTHPVEALTGADRVVRRLDELAAADLFALWDGDERTRAPASDGLEPSGG